MFMETPLHEEPQDAPSSRRQENGIGPFAAIVIVILLLVLGGLYFLFEQANKIHQQELPGQEQVNS